MNGSSEGNEKNDPNDLVVKVLIKQLDQKIDKKTGED